MKTNESGISKSNIRVVPEFRKELDIEKFCEALIEIAKSTKDKKSDLSNGKSEGN